MATLAFCGPRRVGSATGSAQNVSAEISRSAQAREQECANEGLAGSG